MKPTGRSKTGDNHYSVVRYYSQFAHGIVRDVLGENLTLEEARELQRKHKGLIADEDVVIEDQNKQGLESEVVVEEGENKLI